MPITCVIDTTLDSHSGRYLKVHDAFVQRIKTIQGCVYAGFTKNIQESAGKIRYSAAQTLHESSLNYVQNCRVSPCPAEFFIFYFSLFEAGIANAIPSFKYLNIHLVN